jgi:hypothetical protein
MVKFNFKLIENASTVFKRFPLSIASAFLATFLMVHALENWTFPFVENLMPLLLTSIIGISFFYVLHILLENIQNLRVRILLLLLFPLCLGLVFWDLNRFVTNDLSNVIAVRFFGYLLLSHLLVAFATIDYKQGENAFWQYNKLLFIRFVVTALYVIVLSLGLMLALVSLDNLFDFELDKNIYAHVNFMIYGFISVILFFGGIPTDFSKFKDNDDFPSGIRIFGQFILLPLLGIYALILYAYIAKILISQSLPNGFVSYMVLGYSIVGILAFLLIYPFHALPKQGWIKRARTVFYLLQIPLIVLLFVAIGMRVQEYGFTVLRCSLLGLGIFIAAVTFIQLVWRNSSLRIIPILLFIVTILVWFMPFVNAWDVSKSNQTHELLTLLKKNNMVQGGKIVQPSKKLKNSERFRMYDIVNYLVRNHGVTGLEPAINIPLKQKLSEYRTTNFIDSQLLIYHIFDKYSSYSFDTTYYKGSLDSLTEDMAVAAYMPEYSYEIFEKSYGVVNLKPGNWKQLQLLKWNRLDDNIYPTAKKFKLSVSPDKFTAFLNIEGKVIVIDLKPFYAQAGLDLKKKMNTKDLDKVRFSFLGDKLPRSTVLNGKRYAIEVTKISGAFESESGKYRTDEVEMLVWVPK